MPTSETTSNKARFIEAIEHGYSVLGDAGYAGVTCTLPYNPDGHRPPQSLPHLQALAGRGGRLLRSPASSSSAF